MLWSKMRCGQCEHYVKCPLKTRMFVNYCGSRRERNADDIDAAVTDCKARRTFIVQYRRPSVLSLQSAARTRA